MEHVQNTLKCWANQIEVRVTLDDASKSLQADAAAILPSSPSYDETGDRAFKGEL